MDAATLELLRSSLTHVLTEKDDLPLTSRLEELGWDEVLVDDAPGALQALFSIKGATLSPADALGPLLARSLAISTGRPELAAAMVVLPLSLHPDRLSARVEGGRLVTEGVTTGAVAGSATVVPVEGVDGVEGGGGLRLAILPPDVGWSSQGLKGIDPSLRLTRVSTSPLASAGDWIDGLAASAAWHHAIAQARWALATELVAISGHVIVGAVAYTGERRQYGRAIGTFQALQHRLAGAHASVVGATQVAAEAATAGSSWVSLVAKALAGRAAENACTQAQQSYGAIGFTWEHELHRYLKRTYVLDRMFGDWRTLEREIGATLIEAGDVPRIGTL